MVRENFQIYGVKITRKMHLRVKKLNLFLLIPSPRQKSPPGSYHHAQLEGITHSPNAHTPRQGFFENLFREETMEMQLKLH